MLWDKPYWHWHLEVSMLLVSSSICPVVFPALLFDPSFFQSCIFCICCGGDRKRRTRKWRITKRGCKKGTGHRKKPACSWKITCTPFSTGRSTSIQCFWDHALFQLLSAVSIQNRIFCSKHVQLIARDDDSRSVEGSVQQEYAFLASY